MKQILKRLAPVLDALLIPFVFLAAHLMKLVRIAGVRRLPRIRALFNRVGIYPILDHFYEPLFNPRYLRHPLSLDRNLPGIEWNEEAQLTLLSQFDYAEELTRLASHSHWLRGSPFHTGPFLSGDAEYWYSLIRWAKPERIIEIGSGFSTEIASKAIEYTKSIDPTYKCEHICIEPFQNAWVANLDLTLIQQRVETLDLGFFNGLDAGDVLFIDSSHIIRPQGDVLYEYLQLLPSLKKGVIVHVHDIFSPKDYLERWVIDDVKLWNEQYLLEAFLTNNESWEIIGALNFLHHNYYAQLKDKCPFLTPDREPGSFYMQKAR